MEEFNYLPHLTYRGRESFQSLMGYRLCVERRSARKSTDVTQVLRWLMKEVGVNNLSQLQKKIDEGTCTGYLKQYFNTGAKPSSKPKLMTIANMILFLESAYDAKLLTDRVALGSMLIEADKDEVLGHLAAVWRSKKYPYPANQAEWDKAWRLVEIEANKLWDRRKQWHKELVLIAIESKANRVEDLEDPESETVVREMPHPQGYVAGQTITGARAWVEASSEDPTQ
jgi:hypothetical protein